MTLQINTLPLLTHNDIITIAHKYSIEQIEPIIVQLYNKRYIEQDIEYEVAYRAFAHVLLLKKALFDRRNKIPYIYVYRKEYKA
jgi:hypothetical protein